MAFLYDEFLLRLLSSSGIFRSVQYPVLTALAAGFFCAFITSFGSSRIRQLICRILLFLSAVWFITQTLLNRVYAMYFPVASIGSGAGGVASQYTDMLLRTILLGIPVILLYLLPLAMEIGGKWYIRRYASAGSGGSAEGGARAVFNAFFTAGTSDQTSGKGGPDMYRLSFLSGILLLCAVLFQAAAVLSEAHGAERDVYAAAYTFDNATRTFGLLTSTRLDLKYMLFGNDNASSFELESDLSLADGSYSLNPPAVTSAAEEPDAPDSSAEAPNAAVSAAEETDAAISAAVEPDAAVSAAVEPDAAVSAAEEEAGTESASAASVFAAEGDDSAALSAETDPLPTDSRPAGPLVFSDKKAARVSRRGPVTFSNRAAEDESAPTPEPDVTTAPDAGSDESAVYPDSAGSVKENAVPAEENTASGREDAMPAEEKENAAPVEENALPDQENAVSAEAEQVSPDSPEPNAMDLDFSALAAESSGTAQAISAYVSTLTPSMQNAWTGLFKGKNLILICAEAYNDSFVSKELTPTLYRMTHEGFYFSDFYQPAWGGSTSTGEFSMLFGLAPQNSSNTILQTQNSNNYFTMGNQLQRLGYHSWAFHNGTDTYYSRDKTHKNLGYDEWIAMGSGLEQLSGGKYLDDQEMFDVTMDLYMDRQPFSVYYMSVSGHAPYSNPDDSKVTAHIERVKEVLGDHYSEFSQNTINYICYQMVLEDALTLMVERLEEAGIAEDTVIAMTGDHYPYGLRGSEWGNSGDNIENLYGHEDSTPWGLDKTGCIIWSECLEKADRQMAVEIDTPTYSLDMLPTLSNLFGLEYDSRLLIGRDVFSDQMPLVLWNNGSWITDRGRYNARTGAFEAAEVYKSAEATPKSPAAAAEDTALAAPASSASDAQSHGPRILRDIDALRDLLTVGPPERESLHSQPPVVLPPEKEALVYGPEDEAEYTEWVRSVVRNKLAFSKQVIDSNYYETLFGKDETGAP